VAKRKKTAKRKPAAAPKPSQPTDASALRPDQVAELLSKASGRKMAAAEVQRHVDAGAPTNGDGTINLIHFAAWLAARVP
jgi:hypothetical protein